MKQDIAAIVIGVSQGGLSALSYLLPGLPKDFNKSLLIVQHRSADSDSYLSEHLNLLSKIRVKEAEEKSAIEPGCAYIAPPDYHLLVETDGSIALSADELVNYTRPAIDVLFDSAANYYREHLLGIVLTGNNQDGALGLKKIAELGGLTVVQDPNDAEVASMPKAAIKQANLSMVLSLQKIQQLLIDLP